MLLGCRTTWRRRLHLERKKGGSLAATNAPIARKKVARTARCYLRVDRFSRRVGIKQGEGHTGQCTVCSELGLPGCQVTFFLRPREPLENEHKTTVCSSPSAGTLETDAAARCAHERMPTIPQVMESKRGELLQANRFDVQIPNFQYNRRIWYWHLPSPTHGPGTQQPAA